MKQGTSELEDIATVEIQTVEIQHESWSCLACMACEQPIELCNIYVENKESKILTRWRSLVSFIFTSDHAILVLDYKTWPY